MEVLTGKEIDNLLKMIGKESVEINKIECPHCKWMKETFDYAEESTNREYWIMTEVFVYLHNGKDYCDWGKNE